MTQRFRITEDEAIFGLGQTQEGRLNWREAKVDLCQGNMRIAMPFIMSTRGVCARARACGRPWPWARSGPHMGGVDMVGPPQLPCLTARSGCSFAGECAGDGAPSMSNTYR